MNWRENNIKNWILLENKPTVHLFRNPYLLCNIRPASETVGLHYNFDTTYCDTEGQVPWLASTATFRPPLNAGSMALGSTTFWQRHGVRKGGGGQGPERGGEWTGGAGETGNGRVTDTGELGRGEEANGGGKGKGDRWW